MPTHFAAAGVGTPLCDAKGFVRTTAVDTEVTCRDCRDLRLIQDEQAEHEADLDHRPLGMPAMLALPMPDGDQLLAVIAVRLRPDGGTHLQLHDNVDPAMRAELHGRDLSKLLRFFADRLDIDRL